MLWWPKSIPLRPPYRRTRRNFCRRSTDRRSREGLGDLPGKGRSDQGQQLAPVIHPAGEESILSARGRCQRSYSGSRCRDDFPPDPLGLRTSAARQRRTSVVLVRKRACGSCYKALTQQRIPGDSARRPHHDLRQLGCMLYWDNNESN